MYYTLDNNGLWGTFFFSSEVLAERDHVRYLSHSGVNTELYNLKFRTKEMLTQEAEYQTKLKQIDGKFWKVDQAFVDEPLRGQRVSIWDEWDYFVWGTEDNLKRFDRVIKDLHNKPGTIIVLTATPTFSVDNQHE